MKIELDEMTRDYVSRYFNTEVKEIYLDPQCNELLRAFVEFVIAIRNDTVHLIKPSTFERAINNMLIEEIKWMEELEGEEDGR